MEAGEGELIITAVCRSSLTLRAEELKKGKPFQQAERQTCSSCSHLSCDTGQRDPIIPQGLERPKGSPLKEHTGPCQCHFGLPYIQGEGLGNGVGKKENCLR